MFVSLMIDCAAPFFYVLLAWVCSQMHAGAVFLERTRVLVLKAPWEPIDQVKNDLLSLKLDRSVPTENQSLTLCLIALNTKCIDDGGILNTTGSHKKDASD